MAKNFIEAIFDTVVDTISYAVEIVVGIFEFIRGKITEDIKIYNPDAEYKPSEKDLELIENSKELIVTLFGDTPCEALLEMDLSERVKCIESLLNDIAQLYNIEVSQLVFEELDPTLAGYFELDTESIHINITYLAINEINAMKEVINTLFHECRHAIQNKAISEPEEYGFDIRTVNEWRNNFNNYINAFLDPMGYWYQAVEFDARNFADSIVANL